MSACEKLPDALRILIPAGMVCALPALVFPGPTAAQADRPAPAPPAVAGDVAPELSLATPPGPSVAPDAAPRASSTDADGLPLWWTSEEPSEAGGPAADIESLRGFLPSALYRDVLELRDRVVRMRTHLFGRRGIVSVGQTDESGDLGRLRVNLQYDPDPGLRVTVVTD